MFPVFVLALFIVFTKKSVSQQNTVTCGSVLKLVNTDFNARLHSHQVQYGSGSKQQSVTAVSDEMDTNSYWQVVERNGSPQCNRGRVIKCGQKIRLMHLSTRKYLHSHHFQSPLSPNYEVSAFGENGVGDEGDDWQVICDGAYWKQSSNIRLKHISTEGYLHLSGKQYSRPISGQYEVSSTPKLTNAITWIATEGVYIDPVESINKSTGSTYSHDEF